MKTRKQLRADGIELHGDDPPEWFKLQSDGCSVEPFRTKKRILRNIAAIPNAAVKFLLQADHARKACYRHDYAYYLLAIEFEEGTAEWVGARMAADWNLKRNRALVGRNKFIGWIYSRMYFRAVRVGGKYAMKLAPNLFVPPALEDVQQLVRDHLRKPLTPKAEAIIEKWIRLRDAE